MKYTLSIAIGLAALVLGDGSVSLGAANAQPAETKPPTQGVAVAALTQSLSSVALIPQSVFRVPVNVSQGRNPFFPLSKTLLPTPIPDNTNQVVVPETPLTLSGLSGPPKRTAIVNGRTFEAGEQAEVRLPSGSKMLIKCEEIKDESAVFLIAGQRRELRMRDSQK